MPTKSKSLHPIARLRATLGMTSDELGSLSGFSGASIRGIENARVSVSSTLARQICVAFGVSPHSLHLPGGHPMALWTDRPYTADDQRFYAGALDAEVKKLFADVDEVRRVLGSLGCAWFGSLVAPGVRDLVGFLLPIAESRQVKHDSTALNAAWTWAGKDKLEESNLGQIVQLLVQAAKVQGHETSETRKDGRLQHRKHILTIFSRDGTETLPDLEFCEALDSDGLAGGSGVRFEMRPPQPFAETLRELSGKKRSNPVVGGSASTGQPKAAK